MTAILRDDTGARGARTVYSVRLPAEEQSLIEEAGEARHLSASTPVSPG